MLKCLLFVLGILPIERLVDVEEQEFSKLAALIYHYGHTSPGANIKLYHQLITKLAGLFQERCSVNTKSKCCLFASTNFFFHRRCIITALSDLGPS